MRLLKILIFCFFFGKFSKFFFVSEGSLLNFLIFCNKLDFQQAQRVPPSTILKTLRFLSLGYGADLGRSRLDFLRTTDITLKGPLFTETTKTTEAKSSRPAET